MFEFLKRIFGRDTASEASGVVPTPEVRPVAEIQPGPFAQDQAAPARASRKTAGRKQPAKSTTTKTVAAPKVPRPGSRRTKKS
jgi:hypothetical protein